MGGGGSTPEGVGTHRQPDTGRTRAWVGGRTKHICIIALATARPGTTIVISCAGTRDSDRLAPWEWAAGCMGQFLRRVCRVGWSALPLAAWLVC